MTDPNQEVPGAPAADQSPTQSGASSAGPAAGKTQAPSMGRIVIVRREHHANAPGIVTAVHEDDSVDVQVFAGDHLIHVVHNAVETSGGSEALGWFWPPRV